jgi:hypothetical protein
MGGTCDTHRREERFMEGLVGKHEGKRKIGRPRRRWEGNVTINLKEKNTRVCIRLIWLRTETRGGFW